MGIIVSEGMLESEQSGSNLVDIGSIGILPAGMLEPYLSQSNLDQNWLKCMEIVSQGLLESQHSRSNLHQSWLRIIGILLASMLEPQPSPSNLDQN